MNRYVKIYYDAYDRDGTNWKDSAAAALAADLGKAIGEPTRISGPFGLRSEVIIEVGKKRIIITPEFSDNHQFMLFCDTGEKTNDYPAVSLGAWNNMDNIRIELPDTLDEIIKYLR